MTRTCSGSQSPPSSWLYVTPTYWRRIGPNRLPIRWAMLVGSAGFGGTGSTRCTASEASSGSAPSPKPPAVAPQRRRSRPSTGSSQPKIGMSR